METERTEARRWTRAEYDRMVESGIIAPDERVELVDGEMVQVSPQGRAHAAAVRRAQAALQRIFREGYCVQAQLPLSPDPDSEPEPDVAVLEGSVEDFDDAHPASAALVLEVANTSLEFDRGKKAGLYARAGIPEYWIVNLIDGRLEIHRDPVQEPSAAVGWRYRTIQSLAPGARVVPLGAAGAIDVAELLPRSAPERR